MTAPPSKPSNMAGPDIVTLFRNMPVAALIIGPDRTIKMVNDAAETLIHKGTRRMVGQPISEIVRFEDDRIRQSLSESDANITARNTLLILEDDNRKSVDMMLSPVSEWDGWQLLLVIESGSGQKMLSHEILQDGFGVKGSDILAHEIKNPLAAIKGAAQLLERQLEVPGKKLTGLISAEVDRIALLIDQMQSLTRPNIMRLEACNIYQPLSRAREILQTANPKIANIVEEFDPSIPQAMASPENLVQVVLNLLTNALEAEETSKDRIITVKTRFVSGISLRLSDGDGEQTISLPIEIRISDNGPGISPDIIDDIFSPFVTTKHNSQGLGLALTQKLVREMNGRIIHERDENLGLTHFRLFLPLADRKDPI